MQKLLLVYSLTIFKTWCLDVSKPEFKHKLTEAKKSDFQFLSEILNQYLK